MNKKTHKVKKFKVVSTKRGKKLKGGKGTPEKRVKYGPQHATERVDKRK